MGKLLIIILISYFGVISQSHAHSEVFVQITKAAPHLSEDLRLQLSIEIRTACTKHKIQCDIFTAILAQESMFKVSAYNKRTQDLGMGQVNRKTAAAHGFCEQKLLTNRQYSINAAAEVFAYFQRRYGAKEARWFCRYNVGTRRLDLNLETACDNYVKAVKRFL